MQLISDRRVIGILILALALGTPRLTTAQRRQVHGNGVWIGSSGEQPLGAAWGASLSIEHRRSSFVAVPRQMNFTGTLLRDLGSRARFGLGMAHYHTSPNDDFGPGRPADERRIFQQLTASHRLFGAQWSHRLRYEQRWLAANPLPGADRVWRYTSRGRHQVRVVRPIDGRDVSATKLYVAPSLEGFVRMTEHSGVFFEQTRAGVALGLGVAPRMNLEVGYLRTTAIRIDEVSEVHDVLQIGARIPGHARR